MEKNLLIILISFHFSLILQTNCRSDERRSISIVEQRSHGLAHTGVIEELESQGYRITSIAALEGRSQL